MEKHNYPKTRNDTEMRHPPGVGPNTLPKGWVRAPSCKEKRKIRKLLSMSHESKFTRCPHKTKKTIKEFEAKGDFSHSDTSHWCTECGCKWPAGKGTNHYGHGWCYYHESRRPKRERKIMSETHKVALQTGHPLRFLDADDWYAGVMESGKDSQDNVELRSEIDHLRGTLREVEKKFREDEKESSPLIKAISKLSKAMKEAQFIDPEQGEEIKAFIEKVHKSTVTPLTESDGKPMSDATRIRLVVSLTKAVADISKNKLALDMVGMIDYDDFKRFFKQLFLVVKKHIPEEKEFNDMLEEARHIEEPLPAKVR